MSADPVSTPRDLLELFTALDSAAYQAQARYDEIQNLKNAQALGRASGKLNEFLREHAYEALKSLSLLTAKLERAERELQGAREALKTLKNWRTDAVLGYGDYKQGLLCGVEDRGFQANGYEAMRFGYDRAIERVAEEIDGTIEAALQPAADGAADGVGKS